MVHNRTQLGENTSIQISRAGTRQNFACVWPIKCFDAAAVRVITIWENYQRWYRCRTENGRSEIVKVELNVNVQQRFGNTSFGILREIFGGVPGDFIWV